MTTLTDTQQTVLAAVQRLGSAMPDELAARLPGVPLADWRAAVADLLARRLIRDLPVCGIPCWRITHAGRHILSAVRATPRGCPPPASPEPA